MQRKCDACGKEKEVYGGRTCSRGHFICAEHYSKESCPLCGEPLR